MVFTIIRWMGMALTVLVLFTLAAWFVCQAMPTRPPARDLDSWDRR